MVKSSHGLLLLTTVLLVVGCSDQPAASDAQRTGPFTVYTTFYPTEYFCQRIGGDLIEVVCPLPEDADPIYWKPDAATLRAFQEADLIVVNGAGLEQWVAQVSLPDARVVDTARVFRDDWLRYEDRVTHSHGPGGEHVHEGIDGHTWLDPVLATRQAEQILEALVARLPGDEARLREGYDALAADLAALDTSLAAAGGRDKPVLASHPAYNYLARRYGWQVLNLDLDPESLPGEASLKHVRELVRTHGPRALLWESAPSDEVAALFQVQMGVQSVVLSPVESLGSAERRADQDYLTIMRAGIDRLESVSP